MPRAISGRCSSGGHALAVIVLGTALLCCSALLLLLRRRRCAPLPAAGGIARVRDKADPILSSEYLAVAEMSGMSRMVYMAARLSKAALFKYFDDQIEVRRACVCACVWWGGGPACGV